MPFDRPTLSQIVSRIVSDIQTRVTNGVTLLRRSVYRILARVYGGAVHLMYGYLEFQKDQLFASSADGEHLDIQGGEFGVPRDSTDKAEGSGTATGTVGTSIPKNTKLTSATGISYLTDDAGVIGSGALVVINITAEFAGVDGNEEGGGLLTFVSPIPGVSSTFTLDSNGMENGTNIEDDDIYRDRILVRKRRPPHGGSEHDYAVWAREVTGVTRAWAIPEHFGAGTISVIFIRDNDVSPLPDASERQTVYDYIISHTDPITGKIVGIPVTAEPGFQVPPTTYKTFNFAIAIYPNTLAVQEDARNKIEDLFLANGGSNLAVYLSQVGDAVSSATDEQRHEITFPTEDLTTGPQEVHQVGTITWSEKG